jgi:hypothetical protein
MLLLVQSPNDRPRNDDFFVFKLFISFFFPLERCPFGMDKDDEREALLRAGLFGVHEVVVYSLNKILMEEVKDEAMENFSVYCEATIAFCELFYRNRDVIFSHMLEWNEVPGLAEFVKDAPPKEATKKLFNTADEGLKRGVSHVDLFRPSERSQKKKKKGKLTVGEQLPT